MALATLSIDLVAQLANLQQGMDKAGRLADKNAALIEARYQRVQGALVGIGAALGAAFSVSQLTQFFRTTVDGLDALNDLADATGASVENLSALEDIAARTGTQMGTVGDAVIKLNKALGDAKPGSEVAAAFKALGLSAEELKRVDPAEALRRVAVALAGYADDGNKARVTQELFGKSLKEVAPLLKDLAEAGQLNGTVTKAQAEEAEKFNKQLSALGKNVVDVARDVSGPLVTALNRFFDTLGRAKADPGGFLANIGQQLNVDFIRERLAATQQEIERLAPDADRARGILAGQPDSFRAKAALAEYASLQRAAQDYRAELDKILYAGKGGRPANEGGGRVLPPGLPDLRPDKPVVPGESQRDPSRALEPAGLSPAALAALKAIEDTDTSKVVALNAALDELFARRASGLGGGVEVDEAIDKLRDALQKLTPEGRAALDSQARFNAILAQTPTEQMKVVLADIERINRAFEGAPEKAEQWAEAIRVATESLRKGTEEATVQISEFAQQAARNIQDALGDSVLATIEGNANSIEDIWKNMLKRLVAQAAAAQLGKYLLGDQYGSTGHVGGAAGTFIDFLKGLGGGARAGGGPVYAGRPYLVGERGPELVVPRSNGTVVPNNALGGGGGGGSSITINVQGDASENTVRLIRGALAQYEARQMTRGRA